MRIIICGATGFIGKNLYNHLSKNHEVIPIGRDLRDPEFVNANIRDADILIQAAAVTSGCGDTISTPWLHVTDNAVMNSYILREAHKNGVKHVIFPSCTLMYPPFGTVTEDTPPSPHSRYLGIGNTKLYIEKMCEFYASLGAAKFTAIRLSNSFGPYDKFDLQRGHMIGSTFRKISEATDSINMWGDGSESRDVLYIEDYISMIDAVILYQKEPFRIYNCGSGAPVTIKNLAQAILGGSGKTLEINWSGEGPQINTNIALDCTRAKEELGWEPKVTLEEGIEKTWAFTQENGF